MYKLNVPSCDSIDCLKSSLFNFSSVSTLSFPEKGGRTVDTLCLPDAAAYELLWNSKTSLRLAVLVERYKTLGCIYLEGTLWVFVLRFCYVLRFLRPYAMMFSATWILTPDPLIALVLATAPWPNFTTSLICQSCLIVCHDPGRLSRPV
jgi:hypothetical protein